MIFFINICTSRLPIPLTFSQTKPFHVFRAWHYWIQSLVFVQCLDPKWSEQIGAAHCNQFNFHVCSMKSAYGARKLPVRVTLKLEICTFAHSLGERSREFCANQKGHTSSNGINYIVITFHNLWVSWWLIPLISFLSKQKNKIQRDSRHPLGCPSPRISWSTTCDVNLYLNWKSCRLIQGGGHISEPHPQIF